MAAVLCPLAPSPAELLEQGARAPAPTARLSACAVGSTTSVVRVGTPGQPLSALERRLLELGFFVGERVQVLAEARPGRDPFVVRVGSLTLALRRREADDIWVSASAEESSSPER